MPQETLFELFLKALEQIVRETIAIIPKLLIAVVVLVVAFLIIRLVGASFKKLLKLVELDKMFKQLLGVSLPFSLDSLIVYLANFGIFLVAIFAIANLFLKPQQMELVTGTFVYVARIVSIIAVTLIVFALFSVVVEKVRVETRLRGYVLFILLLFVTTMLVDVTALSESVKGALVQGLAIGVGISIGVFAIWFFFHDYFDKLLMGKPRTSRKRKR